MHFKCLMIDVLFYHYTHKTQKLDPPHMHLCLVIATSSRSSRNATLSLCETARLNNCQLILDKFQITVKNSSVFQNWEVILDSEIRWQQEYKRTKMDSSSVFGRSCEEPLNHQDDLCLKPLSLLKMFIRNTIKMTENATAILNKRNMKPREAMREEPHFSWEITPYCGCLSRYWQRNHS